MPNGPLTQMAQDKQTVNVLVLELATMVVAISLAFTATFVASFDINTVVAYIFSNVVVIWFWWGYVVDRLSFPPKTMAFPLLDILILIMISLVPFALKLRETYYIASVVGVLIIVWAFLIRLIMSEYRGELSPQAEGAFSVEVRQRLTIGPLFVADAALSYFVPAAGLFAFVALTLITVAMNVRPRRQKRVPAVG